MNLESVFRRLSRKYLTAASSGSNRSHSPKLNVETLETREVPAVLPAPVIDYTSTRSIDNNAIAPTVAQDPTNPFKLFSAVVQQDGAGGTQIAIMHSTNGGTSWSGANTIFHGLDPLPSSESNPVYFTNVSNPSVSYDRFSNVYLTYVEHNADSSSGRIVLRKYTFNGSTPSESRINIYSPGSSDPFTGPFTDNLGSTVYAWEGTDKAYNPTVGIDSNLATYTDPVTLNVQTDALAGLQTSADKVRVFVAWNTEDVVPSGGTINQNVIRMAVSENGGNKFSPSVVVNDSGYSPDGSGFTSPKIVFTQGQSGVANTGGQMVTVFTDNYAPFPELQSDKVTYTAANSPKTWGAINTNPMFITDGTPPPSGAPSGTPDTPGITNYTINVPAGSDITSLDTLSVRLALYHNDLSQLKIELTSPGVNGKTITLVNNGVDGVGGATGQGITGTNLGTEDVTATFAGFATGTTFADNAVRSITDPGAASPFIGTFAPSGGSLNAKFAGLNAAAITGNWTIHITDFRSSGITTAPFPLIREAELRFGQNFKGHLGNDSFSGLNVNTNSPSGTGHTNKPAVLPTAGEGAGLSIARDNSLGSYSPFQNQIYAAYDAGGTVMVGTSADGGQTWSSTSVGAGFLPQVTVDPLTGTVVVSYYSTSQDPAGTRALTMLATSVDGGQSFSAPAPINQYDTTYDQIRSKTIQTEYVPSNGPAQGAEGFGNNMGLVAYGGAVNVVYAGNVDFALNQIRTQTINIASGPRVASSDTGTVFGASSVVDKSVTPFVSIPYNGPAANGQAGFDGFVVTFDRVVNPTTFTAADIKIIYRAPGEDAQSDGTQIPAASVQPLDNIKDPITGISYGSQRFLVRLAQQTAPGTYSYVVGNLGAAGSYEGGRFGSTDTAGINDRIRGTKYSLVKQPITIGDTYTSANFAFPATPTPIVDKLGSTITPLLSTMTLPAPASPQDVIGGVTVNVNITHANVSQLKLTLTSPTGIVIPLMLQGDAKPDSFGTLPANLTNTVFSDAGADRIASTLDNAPYTGTYLPISPLGVLFGGQIDGDWTLTVTDGVAGTAGTLTDWSLTITRARPVASVSGGNQMDQNGNSIQNEPVADVYSVPNAKNGTPFILPYVPESLPVTVPGPRIVDSKPVGSPHSADNSVVNLTTNGLDVQFDRVMNTGTLTTVDILRITGPRGDIANSGLTITPITALGGAVTSGNSKFYRITFPVQKLAGNYVIQLGSNIADTNGVKMDKDSNAGVKMLLGQVDPTTAVTPISYGGAINLNIAAGKTATASVNINGANDGYLLQKLTANLSISVPGGQLRSLEARLVSPDGSLAVPLFINSPTTGNASSATNVTFTDDPNGTPVQNGFANNGFNNPIQPLAQFNNILAKGNWTLVIRNKGTVSANLSSFSLQLNKPNITSGVGDTVADQTGLHFRIFQADGSTDTAKQNWNPAGPDGNTTGQTTVGRVSNVQVDQTDPSGNTVFASGASGGVWRTTNFLTRDPKGPNWVPLTDFGTNQILRDANGNIIRSGGTINVGSIALFNESGDPADTKVLVGTGSSSLNTIDNPKDFGRFDGVGFLYSPDAGKSWQILDSRVNYGTPTGGTVPGFLPVTDTQRDHSFVGTVINKIVFEKKITPNSNLPIIYAAVGQGSTPAAENMAGLWRSIDGGRSWEQVVKSNGDATDFAIGEGSALPNTFLRPTIGYLAVEGTGIFLTTNLNADAAAGINFNLMNGGLGRPTVNTGALTVGSGGSPNGGKGRIQLVTPQYISNDPLANNYYKQWLVAAVSAADGRFDGLYVTKDRGQNWTRLNLNTSGGFSETGGDLESLNLPNNWFSGSGARHSLSLAMDPLDPNILYVGADRIIRVDMTLANDPYKLQLFTHTDPSGQIYRLTTGSNQNTTTGGGLISTDPNTGLDSVTPVDSPLPAPLSPELNSANGTFRFDNYDPALSRGIRAQWNFTNLKFDPYAPFLSDASIATYNISSFVNNGVKTTWNSPFVGRDALARPIREGGSDFDWVGNIITTIDPLTGKTRVLYGHDEGLGTFVSNSDGSLDTVNIFNQPNQNLTKNTNLQVEGSRNGDIQIARIYSGDTQPSLLAASISQSLLLAAGHRGGDVYLSDQGQLGNGNNSYSNDPRSDRTNYVAADQTGTGTVYILRRINDITNGVPTDFFQVQQNGGSPISRTNGLFENTTSDPLGTGQWDNSVRKFSVNPIDPNGIAISSNTGRLFTTNDQGLNWNADPSTPAAFGTSTNLSAIAYGAPVLTSPGHPVVGLNDYMYVGTAEGKIFVQTKNVLAPNWKEISNGLDGAVVQKIVPSPVRGSNAVYAVTNTGVFYMADWTATTKDANGATIPDPILSVWKNITGTGSANLFALTNTAFQLGSSYQNTTLRQLSSIAVDWRPLYSSTPGTPILYAAGDGGVFRSTDNGSSWARFAAGSGSTGGGMPVVKVTDIDLALGNVVQGTGRTDSTGSPDMLVASTLGRGMWTLALGKPAGVTGPKIVAENVSPLSPVSVFQSVNVPGVGVQNFVTVAFDGYVAATSFTAADVTIIGPNGVAIPATGVDDITLPDSKGVNLHNRYRIRFAPQTAEGTYTITVGPNITDGGGTPMNQNGNAANGEPITSKSSGDAFVFQAVIAGGDIADFIKDTYVKLFGRQPTTAEYLAKSAAIETARLTGLGTVVKQLLTGYDPTTKTYPDSIARTQLVTRLFAISGGAVNEIGNLLPAHVFAPGEVASLVGALNNGTKTPETLVIDIVSGTEYFTASGGTADGFLTKLYADLFKGQSIDPINDLDPKVLTAQRTQAGTATGRKALATSLVNGGLVKYDADGVGVGSITITTTDFRTNFINLAYNKYLGRVSTAVELKNAKLAMTRFGKNLPGGSENVYAGIFATKEYFNAKIQNEPAAPNGAPADNGQHTNRAWIEAVIKDRYFATPVGGLFSTPLQRDTYSQKILNTFTTTRQTFARTLTLSPEYRALQITNYFKLVHGSTRIVNDTELAAAQKYLLTGTMPGLIATRLASAEFAGTNTPPNGQQTMYTITGVDPSTVTGTAAQIAVQNSVIWARATYSVLFNTLLTSSDPAILFLSSFSRTSGRTAAALAVLNAVDGTTLTTASKFKPTTGLGGTYRESFITSSFQSILGRNPVGPFTNSTTEAGKYLTFLKTNRWEYLQADLLIGREFYEVVG